MRRLFAIVSVAVLVLAACGTSAAPTAVPTTAATEPPAATTPAPTPAATPAPAPTEVAVDVQIAFDGTTCTYRGPMVVVDNTRLMVTFTSTSPKPDPEVLLIAAVAKGTTWDKILDTDIPAGEFPDWMIRNAFTNIEPGTGTFLLRHVVDEEVGGYFVGCFEPEASYPAALITFAD